MLNTYLSSSAPAIRVPSIVDPMGPLMRMMPLATQMSFVESDVHGVEPRRLVIHYKPYQAWVRALNRMFPSGVADPLILSIDGGRWYLDVDDPDDAVTGFLLGCGGTSAGELNKNACVLRRAKTREPLRRILSRATYGSRLSVFLELARQIELETR